METAITGTRIRQTRRDSGLSQRELAERIGISASYLNLIEWNKRPVSPVLLGKIATALNVANADLGGAMERRLRETLLEVAHLPALGGANVESSRTGELIGRFPGWSDAIGRLAAALQMSDQRASTLSDRLSNDPFLAETVHRMLTRIASVRSAADILVEYDDLPEDRRNRFNAVVQEESRTLAEVGEALAAYLHRAEEASPVLTPIDEVEALFNRHGNHFEEIEREASTALTAMSAQPGTRRTQAEAVVREKLSPVLEDIITRHDPDMTAAAKRRAREKLHDYALASVLMPAETFADQALAHRFDVERLAEFYFLDVQSVCSRLTALPKSDALPSFGYIRANAAGTILDMLPLEGLSLPRYAAACPLWVLYRAQQSPEHVIAQRTVFPSGKRFVLVARAHHFGQAGFGRPRNYRTDMLVMSEADAARTVYAPAPTAVLEEVGLSCRLCPRRNCAHRVEDPLS
ncbi:short-chain fatty acyl-CoA regulator family protein [Tepidamorphus sp. 3E244]|uniref:helix-turn-helix domain-containing protein n=1 Tax=Tepidamorphus sp. 3E244 TaxID=3385498 RepID=UPI0038FD2B16